MLTTAHLPLTVTPAPAVAPSSSSASAAARWLTANPRRAWVAMFAIVAGAWTYGAGAYVLARNPASAGPVLAAVLASGSHVSAALAPRPDLDPVAYMQRLGGPAQVPVVSLTREGAIAIELATHSFSLRPAQAAAAAHALCQSARAEGYDPLLFLAVIGVESSYNHLARSPVGAQGLMQLMPVTAAQLAKEAKVAWQVGMAYDPVVNVRLGVRYIAGLHRRFGHRMDWALTAYNRGPGNTRAILAAHHGGLPAPISAFYAGPVMARYAALKARYGRLP